MSEVQWTLKDVTSAWLIFPRHQHQVVVDKHCDLKEEIGRSDLQKEGEKREKGSLEKKEDEKNGRGR